tara:strand:- start:304 stop:573 length:270 start_codon:yes stop_codon:yes gene_type:complete
VAFGLASDAKVSGLELMADDDLGGVVGADALVLVVLMERVLYQVINNQGIVMGGLGPICADASIDIIEYILVDFSANPRCFETEVSMGR